jgi:hypothetical protein
MRLDLKGGRADQWVTTADGKRDLSYAWYHVPLLDLEGHIRMVKASGVVSTARIKTGRKGGRAYGNLSDMEREAVRSTWGWECADMVIGRDNMDCKPEHICGWCGWERRVFPWRSWDPQGSTSGRDRERN